VHYWLRQQRNAAAGGIGHERIVMNISNITFGAAFVISTLFGSAVLAQTVEFDLFGMQIGDTLEEVDQIATERGFEPSSKPLTSGPDFEQAVAIRRGEISRSDANNAVAEARYVRGEDRLTIEFAPWPEGSSVSRIIYRPRLGSLDDCPGFLEAFEARYGHGIEYAGDWLDRPTVRINGVEQTEAGTVTASASCSFSSPAAIYLTYWKANFVLNDLLDEADGEIIHDF
jgi:hypothetical protein